MNTHTEKSVQRIIEVGTILVIIGVGLNAIVGHTLGAFDAASVVLALYFAFWAYVLGATLLVVLSIWLTWREHAVEFGRHRWRHS